jgi:hypothetical protein
MEGEGKVKYNFKAESPRELNLQKVFKLSFWYNVCHGTIVEQRL